VSKDDAKILDYIGAVRDDRSEFYIKDLVAPLSEMLDRSPAQVLDRLLLLEDKGIIVPIGIQTILQRQGLALVNGAEEFPASVESEPVEELEYEEMEADPVEEPTDEEKTDIDPMEAFVQDVESLLEKEAKDEDKPDADE
jgi:DNA-binding Lrp family transcriptional regulator